MVPLASSVPTVVTIHDVSLRLYPRYHPPRRVLLNGPLVGLAARRANAIITVSESARDDIVRSYKVDPARVRVVYEAAAPSFTPVRDVETLARVRRRYGLAERVILYVGTIEPREEPADLDRRLLRSNWKCGQLSHQLVCVGPYGWMSRGLGERIDTAASIVRCGSPATCRSRICRRCTRSRDVRVPVDVRRLRAASGRSDGCGVPVITGPASALTEVGSNAVHHVDRLDADRLGEALVDLARDGEKRARMAERVSRARGSSRGIARRGRVWRFMRVCREPESWVRLQADLHRYAGARRRSG
jgi:glycosyltransferase involved in cell wall biosynthesis